MAKSNPKKILTYNMLDVGCGDNPKGDVNIDFFKRGFNLQTGDQVSGNYIAPQKIENFIVADALHLPFKDESFTTVHSSHTIEHVREPVLMFREMCRVAKKEVIIRCPHRRGSGAVMPYHLNYFDKTWFKKAASILGYESSQLITAFDRPITTMFEKHYVATPKQTLLWRMLQKVETSRLMIVFRVPFEIEARVKKAI